MLGALGAPIVYAASGSFIGQFSTIDTIASTIPSNGDLNPYGVAVVPNSVGKLVRGDILVSNFNAKSNLQGTGTTLVQISPSGQQQLFAQIPNLQSTSCPGGVGLTAALVVLSRGWVIVGSLPTSDGTSATAKAGCLIVLNSQGNVVETFAGGLINGPWGATALDQGSTATVFVTNVLNGTVAASPRVVNAGTVIRMTLNVPFQGYGVPTRTFTAIVGAGFAERTDPAALVVGPLGLGLSSNGTLYVADSVNNRIAAIPNALTRQIPSLAGTTVTVNGAINDPLGLTIAPNGDILSANGGDGFIVETTPAGTQIDKKLVDSAGNPPGAGNLFGLVVAVGGTGVYFVDDGDNTLKLLH
ncbi:MAG: hypothetical protein JO125_16130 [Chloroflexi bacterium]|nr:hypothetical protein [Chloroflexota bacterium]